MRYWLAAIVTLVGAGVAFGNPWWVAVTSALMVGAAWYDALRPRATEGETRVDILRRTTDPGRSATGTDD